MSHVSRLTPHAPPRLSRSLTLYASYALDTAISFSFPPFLPLTPLHPRLHKVPRLHDYDLKKKYYSCIDIMCVYVCCLSCLGVGPDGGEGMVDGEW